MIKIDITEEEYFLSKAEEYCYTLRDAMIDMSLKFPEIATFERCLNKIKTYGNIAYIMRLLHRCWCFAYPKYLLDAVPKDIPFDKMLDMMLSKYRSPSMHSVITEELNKNIHPLIMAYYKAYIENGKMTMYYGTYMDSLYNIAKNVCSQHSITLAEGFIISATIKTDKTTAQLSRVFDVISKRFKFCPDNADCRRIFISIFDSSVSAPDGIIPWMDFGSSKGREPSLASIYTTFDALGVDMSYSNKATICKYFTWQNGEIMPEQIKSRKNTKQNKLREAICTVL